MQYMYVDLEEKKVTHFLASYIDFIMGHIMLR
jgi:hypothetical protein